MIDILTIVLTNQANLNLEIDAVDYPEYTYNINYELNDPDTFILENSDIWYFTTDPYELLVLGQAPDEVVPPVVEIDFTANIPLLDNSISIDFAEVFLPGRRIAEKVVITNFWSELSKTYYGVVIIPESCFPDISNSCYITPLDRFGI